MSAERPAGPTPPLGGQPLAEAVSAPLFCRDGVRLARDGAVALLTLDRPPVNALDRPMMQALIDALCQVDDDPGLRAVVLTGAGRCFSAGVDLKAQLAALQAGAPGPMDLGVALYDRLLHGRTPRIAAVNGAALGAGLGLAASCHLVLAAEGVQFGLPEIDVGALGGARHAMRLVGHATASRMLLTGQPVAAEALAARGTLPPCLPPGRLIDEALALARLLASKDPQAMALACEGLAAVETLPLLDGYALEADLGRRLGQTPSAQALMQAFLDRRR